MMFADRIRAIGQKFIGRLDRELVLAAIEYVDHNEEFLAFETLCDHLAEYEVPLTSGEYDIIFALARDMEMDVQAGTFKCLEKFAHTGP